MNFNALDEQLELMVPGPVEAIRRRFGPSVPLVIRNANEDCIPFQLRGALRKEFSFGPVEHVVAVKLSADSGNLAAVACNSPEQLAAFQQGNPALQAGLVTRWKGWSLTWLRTDPRPENFAFEPWMWLAQGTIPLCFTADDEEAVPIAREGAPVEIPSSEIQWPGILFEPFRMARLIQSHGPLFLQKNGRRILNEFLWANWLAEKLELTYDSKLGAFRRGRDQGTEVQTLTTGAVIQLSIRRCSRPPAPA